MSALFVRGAGVLGPGLAGWPAARPVLAGESPWQPQPVREPAAEALPPNERRRVARAVRWAMAVALEAVREAGIPAAEAAAVFASSSSDGEILHQICEALAGPAREVSPTRFHNSVHNAAAGYWSIAAGARRASITLCAHDASFAAALLEAAALIGAGERAVLLVACDLPYPPPLAAARPIREPLAVALVLSADGAAPRLAEWRVSFSPEPAEAEAGFGDLASNPVALALPLLAAAARRESRTVRLPFLDGQLGVACRP